MSTQLTPLVSVCVPAFNAEKYIIECINSILNQSYKNIEIIVVNDGSTDQTLAILKSINDPRIKIINQKNSGQCAAANRAFAASKGDYIKFFDSDDILSENLIENQIIKLNGRSDAIASVAWGRFYNNDIKTFFLNPEAVWKDMKPMDWLVKSLENGPNMMQCGLWLIPREILQISGLWDERLSLINDFDFFIRVILASNKILFTENAYLYYRSGLINSLSAQLSRTSLESALLSTKLGIEQILTFENSHKTRRICANALQQWKYIFYPHHMDLYQAAKNQIQILGGSDYRFPAGGNTKILTNLIGWKLTKRLKNLFK